MLQIIINQYYNEILLGLFGVMLLFSIINMINLSRVNKKYRVFMKALGVNDVEKLLLDNLEIVKNVSKENEANKSEINELREILKTCIQKYGIVRFTAFEDVGSDLSFAIALLNGKDDGVILNGIYSRDGSSVFAKPVHNGESKHNLSEEEIKALTLARRRGEEY